METNREVQRQGKYMRLFQNTMVLTVGTFVSKLLVFLLLPLYTDCLSPEEYGTADLVSNLANFLIPIFCLGLSEGVLRFSLRENRRNGEAVMSREAVFSTSVVLTVLGSLLLLLLLPLFRFTGVLASYGVLVVSYVIASNLHSIAAEFIRAAEQTKLYAAQGVLNTALVIAFNLVLLLGCNLGVYGYVLSIVLADAVTTVFLVFYARLYRSFFFRQIRFTVANVLLRFSLPLVPGTLLWWVISVSDRYVLTYFSGGEVNGLYVAAAKIPTLLTLLCTVFLTAWKTSAVVEDSGESEETINEKSAFFSRVYRGFVAILFCAGAGITLCSKLFAWILFDDTYYTAWRYIPILTIGTVFYSLSRFLGSVYFVKQKSVRSSMTAMAAAVLNIALNLILIPRYGAFGAAFATLSAYFLEYIVREIDAQRCLRFRPCRFRILVSSVLLILDLIVVTMDTELSLILSVILTLLIFLYEAREVYVIVRSLLSAILRRSKKVYK